ncbi:MAG: Calx-beta domain-containing protein, partial [Thermodesulfobacteriota bacterium]
MRDTKELQASVYGLILIFLGLLLLVSPCFISEGLAQPAATDQQKELTPDAVRDQLRNDHPGATGDFIQIVKDDMAFETEIKKKLDQALDLVQVIKLADLGSLFSEKIAEKRKAKLEKINQKLKPFFRVDEKGDLYWGPALTNLPGFFPTIAMNIDTAVMILNMFRQRNQEKLAERQKQLAILQAGLSAMPGATRTTTSGTTQTQNVQFSQLIFNVNEDAGKATITVTRNGGSTGPLAVDYRTIDVTATAGKDYYPVSGTLKWSDGDEFPKSFEVTIIDDNEVEKEETIRLELQNPQNPKANVRLGYQWQAELHIIDNDVEQDKPKPPRPPASCKYIIISPQKIEVKPNQTVTFTAIAFFDDGTNRDVTDFALWQPGPGNQYTAPGDLKFDERIKITARFLNCSGSTEINALAPDWSPPMSHASDRTAHATEPPADAHTWFVFCHPDKGEVVYGEHPQIQDKIMAGAFPGPRNAEFWIEQNCPRWRCTTEGACAKGPASGGQWSVICDKKDLHVYSTKSAPDLTRYWIMAQGLLGEPDANFWIQTNCPTGLCTDGGGCAKAGVARKGGKWAVVCDKNNESVGLTEYPNVVSQWIWVDNLFGEPDARMWVNQNCPSWRCDRDGKCAKADAPRKGGKWAVVCDKNNGSVGLTEYPNVVSQWILVA